MKRLGLTIAILVLLSNLSYSQSGYPKLIQLEGDTIVAISMPQMKSLLQMKVNMMECSELNKNYVSQLGIYRLAVTDRDSLTHIYTAQLDIQGKRIADATAVLITVQATLTRAEKKIKRLKTHRTILGILFIIATGAAAIGLSN